MTLVTDFQLQSESVVSKFLWNFNLFQRIPWMWAFHGRFQMNHVQAWSAMKTICRTSAFKNLLILIHWGGARIFPCIHNHVLKLLCVVIRTLYISRGKIWRSKGEEILSIHMMTIDNVYRSSFIGKRPKMFYQQYAEINFLLKGCRGIFEYKYGFC